MHRLSTDLVLPWPDLVPRLVDPLPSPTTGGLFQSGGVALGENSNYGVRCMGGCKIPMAVICGGGVVG
jgi:hypothetical protein